VFLQELVHASPALAAKILDSFCFLFTNFFLPASYKGLIPGPCKDSRDAW